MNFLLRALPALLFGSCLTLYILQYDAHFKSVIQNKMTHVYETMFDCAASCTFRNINFFSVDLEAQDIEVSAPDRVAWHWKAASLSLNSSWLQFLLNNKLGLELTLNEVHARSFIYDGYLAITGHIKKMILEAADLPVALKSFMVRKGILDFSNTENSYNGSVTFSSETTNIADRLRTTVYITDGFFTLWTIPFIRALSAQLSFEKPEHSSLALHADGKVRIAFLPAEQQESYINATCDDSQRSLIVCNKMGTFSSTFVEDIKQQCININAQLPLAYLCESFSWLPAGIDGSCVLSVLIDTATARESIKGYLKVDKLKYKKNSIGSVEISFTKQATRWRGTITIDLGNAGKLEGSWHWDEQNQTGELCIWNNALISFEKNYWKVLPNDLQLHCTFDKDRLSGSYSCAMTHEKLGSRIQTEGTISWDDILTFVGAFENFTYELKAAFKPHFTLHHLICTDAQENQLCTWHSNKEGIAGSIDVKLFSMLINNFYDIEVRGNGTVAVKTQLHDNNLTGSLRMINGAIQVPKTYNFIHTVNAELNFDWVQKKLVLQDLGIGLHKGNIKSKRAVISWADKDKDIFMHIPISIENLFLNIDKDIFTVVSGTALFYQNKHVGPLCKGNLIINQGRCKKNIFSTALQKKLAGIFFNPISQSSFTMDCEVALKTAHSLRIETPFLKTDATVALNIKNSSDNPTILGTISLLSGSLHFPYKPLFITRGNIYFVPHQLDDPQIELVAQGKVKKYYITLRVNGSIKHPHISLESTPPLSEVQIVTLLLAGSQEGSVAMAMPSFIMQNVQTLLFGTEQSDSKLELYVKNILEPLKHVRIVPSFVDQTGRGGFRGAIEIDVSDRLHALIQKNFSLPEDTKFEIEYLLSDDVSVRGIKDERGDLGGEVEMRWKF